MNTKPISFSDFQIAFLLGLRAAVHRDKKSGKAIKLRWDEITEKYNKKFPEEQKTMTALQQAEFKYQNLFKAEDFYVKNLKDTHSNKKRNSYTAKQNRELLDYLTRSGDILEGIDTIVRKIKPHKFKFPKIKKSKSKSDMTVELMISDVHFGKLTDTFNLDICKRRIQYLAQTLIKEIERNSSQYDVERIILALLGDMIESATMHGLESASGCEFGNSRQVWECIDSLFDDLFVPVAIYAQKKGIIIDVVGVAGNHDRTEAKRTMHYPGESNLTLIIYKALEKLCKRSGFKHITFDIPKGAYTTLEVYGNKILYEHFDNAKACTRIALEKLLSDRIKQIGEHIEYARGGHFHESTMFGLGKIIDNGSVCGQDSYADMLGFDSVASQTLNYYVKSDRKRSFYRTFPINLEKIS